MLYAVQRTRYTSSDNPFIAIRDSGFYINVKAAELLGFEVGDKVRFYVDNADPKNADRLYFVKTTLNDSEAYVCTQGKRQSNKGLFIACLSIFNNIPRLKKISENKISKDKRFNLKRDDEEIVPENDSINIKNTNFYIPIVPCFEFSLKSVNDLPDKKGIYQLVHNNIVVNIGQGNIRSRVKDKQKNNYQFERVEFSLIEDKNDRVYYEDYYIEKFKNANNGMRPTYNFQDGNSIENINPSTDVLNLN